MKVKFFLLIFLLLFSRVCDFYSTSLWFFDNPTGEQNPLYKFFGIGWIGLIISNIIIVSLIIYAFYFYTFKYSVKQFKSKPNNFTDFVSELYFNETGRFIDVFYRTPKNKKTLLAHLGYVLIRVLIFSSFLAAFHNFCQYYNIAFYNTFRDIIGRPLYVIYVLMLFSFIYFLHRIWNLEYKLSIQNFERNNPK